MNIHIHHFHSKGAIADRAALEQFQQQWATYQKLVDSDALAHQEVGTILHRALAAVAKPFAFLDIACGDADQMRKALAGTKVRHYHGVDLSEPALELAARQAARESGRRLVRPLDPSSRDGREARSLQGHPRIDQQIPHDLRAELERGRDA
jgi:hypothetical protein